MSKATITESHLGKYDRETTVVITKLDGTQEFALRNSRYGAHVPSPLSWWRHLGIYQDDQQRWSKCVNSPEYALLLMKAGITPEYLKSRRLSEPEFNRVLEWFNVFRTFYPDYANVALEFSGRFMRKVDSINKSGRGRNPFSVGALIKRFDGIRKDSLEEVAFLTGQEEWTAAYIKHVASSDDRDLKSIFAPKIVQTMMQTGLPAEVLAELTEKRDGSIPRGYAIQDAIRLLWTRGHITRDKDTNAKVRYLADIMSTVSDSSVHDLFFADGVEDKRLRDVIVVTGVREPVQLQSIFREQTPVALAVGAL